MNLPDPLSMLPPEPQPQPQNVPSDARARRRRARRTFFPSDAEGQAAMLADLARRAYPSYEFYILSILCGAVLGAGYYFDAQAVLVFGALSAPLLTPWVGMALASITGSIRFFTQTFAALLIGAIIVFIIGLVAGFASTPLQPITLNQVYIHSRLWIPDLIVLALGSILLIISFVRTENRPYLPSAMLAYEFFLPVSAAGFGIGAGLIGVWPQAALVFLVHLAWASFFGFLTLAILRFRPLSAGGLAFSAVMVIVFIATLIALTGLGRTVFDYALGTPTPTNVGGAASATAPHPSPTATGTPTPTATFQPVGEALSSSATVDPGSVPPTLLGGDVTFPPTDTLTFTVTIEPTPVYAKINALEGGGAYLRKTPAGEFLATLDNGVVVEVLGETQEVNGVTWVKIAAVKNGIRMEGWVIQSVLLTATPVVNWEPTATPTLTPTP
jgi:hypothetical protein